MIISKFNQRNFCMLSFCWIKLYTPCPRCILKAPYTVYCTQSWYIPCLFVWIASTTPCFHGVNCIWYIIQLNYLYVMDHGDWRILQSVESSDSRWCEEGSELLQMNIYLVAWRIVLLETFFCNCSWVKSCCHCLWIILHYKVFWLYRRLFFFWYQ